MAARYGERVVAEDEGGYPALDLAETVRAALRGAGAALVADARVCTHCSPDHWSWRAHRDRGRQATVAWVPTKPVAGRDWSLVAPGREGDSRESGRRNGAREGDAHGR